MALAIPFCFLTESGRIDLMTSQHDQPIRSMHNPQVQFIRELLKEKSARVKHGLFVVEGIRLAEEVYDAGIAPRLLFYSSQLSTRGQSLLEKYRSRGIEMLELDADLLNRISDTETSQGILCLIPNSSQTPPDHADLILIVDQLRDPGNMGTILRSAAATGVQLVIVTPGSVDPFTPKVVRAAMGAHFRLRIHQADWSWISSYCASNLPAPLRILLADSGGGTSMWQTDLTAPLALVVGGEAEGAHPGSVPGTLAKIHIPMPGNFESLNAGVAASILLYEILRQRNQ